MKRLSLPLMILAMIAFCTPATANNMSNEQWPSENEGGCGGVPKVCQCDILHGFPFLATGQHGVVEYPLPVCPIDWADEKCDGGFWRDLIDWLTSIGEWPA